MFFRRNMDERAAIAVLEREIIDNRNEIENRLKKIDSVCDLLIKTAKKTSSLSKSVSYKINGNIMKPFTKEGVIILDYKGKILHVNNKITTWLNQSEDGLIGTNFLDFNPNGLSANFFIELSKTISCQQINSMCVSRDVCLMELNEVNTKIVINDIQYKTTLSVLDNTPSDYEDITYIVLLSVNA